MDDFCQAHQLRYDTECPECANIEYNTLKRKIIIRPIIRWYDIWIGIFIDRKKQTVYIFPLPCFGIKISFEYYESSSL